MSLRNLRTRKAYACFVASVIVTWFGREKPVIRHRETGINFQNNLTLGPCYYGG